MADDIAKKILDLKSSHASTIRLRAEAEAGLRQAQQTRDNINARLKELGIDPENAEAELVAAEAQLDQTVAELTAAVNAEALIYNEIAAKLKTTGG